MSWTARAPGRWIRRGPAPSLFLSQQHLPASSSAATAASTTAAAAARKHRSANTLLSRPFQQPSHRSIHSATRYYPHSAAAAAPPSSIQWCVGRNCFSSKSGDGADDKLKPLPDDGITTTTTAVVTNDNENNETQEFQIPGAQAGTGKKLAIVYTCKVCDTRSIKQFSEHSYQNGVVLVRCPGCENLHLIADRLGMFSDKGGNDGTGWDIESALAKMGENVNVVNNDNVLELSMEDLVGTDAMEKLSSTSTESSEAETDDNHNDDDNDNKSKQR